jgi:WD40 repeat protein
MMRNSLLLASGLVLAMGIAARAEGPGQAPRSKQPILRVEAGGPTAFVTSLAFSADGRTLYAAGFDKVVRVWTLDSKTDRFELSSTSYRVPIGPGLEGVINSIALSSDGAWLAVGGSALFQDRADFGEPGFVVSRKGMTKAMWLERGTIFVFNTKTGEMKRLVGHEGVVLSLAFADKGPILVSAGRDRVAAHGNKYVGAVRVWDLDTKNGTPLRLGADLPDPVYDLGKGKQFVTRPGLAAWRVGDGPKEIRVAIAADDPKNGTLRLWDVVKGLLWDDGQDGIHNNALAFRPGNGKLYTGSFRNPSGHVQFWNVAPPAGSVPSGGVRLSTGMFVRALSLFSVPGKEKLSHAAVVLRSPSKGDEVRLQTIDLENDRPIGESILLWSETADQPALATSPHGSHLAVAGNRDNSIHVFAIKDLLGGKTEPIQKLRSVGATMNQIAFVKKDKNRGIVLRQGENKPNQQFLKLQQDDLVFDISNRSLSQDLKDWVFDSSLQPSADKVDLVKKPKLTAGAEISAQAYLAAQKPLGVPLLAVAVDVLGETQLQLYNAETLEQFRQFTGHVNTIRSLTFSSDGKLLASVGNDQTVCIWSLSDLQESLGHLGQIAGLSVRENQGKLVISDLEDSSLVPENRKEIGNKQVHPDDIIEGVLDKGQLKKMATAQDFYFWLASHAPAQKVTLRVAERGNVDFVVSQGIDERKPLFSLFFAKNADAKIRQWDWLGWSPVGPFDSSDRKVERLVGWHQNLGDSENRRVQFSHVEEFRKDNFKPGILKDLIDYGNAGQAIDAYQRRIPQPPREPRMSLGVLEDEDIIAPDEQGRYRVQLKPVTLTLNLTQKPSGKVNSVVWEMAGLKGKLAPAGNDSWTADLSSFPWKRGETKVHVELRTEAPVAGPFTRELTILYQPAKPKIELLSATPRVVDNADYPVRALVTPGKGQIALVRLLHKVEGQEAKEIQKQNISDKPGEIKDTLNLKPGINQIQIFAKNESAADKDVSEIASESLEVLYKSKQPLITIQALELPDGSEDVTDLSKTIEVDSPSFKIKGQVEAIEKITLASWKLGDAKESQSIEGFEKGQNKFSFGQAFTLEKPGENTTITFAAKAANSDEVKKSVTISFRPKLPKITLVNPAERVLIEGRDKSVARLKADLTWPDAAYPCQAQVMVNGKPQGQAIEVAAKSPTFLAEVRLGAGNNEVAVQLTSQWQKDPRLTRRALIVFRRPPRIVAFQQTATNDKPPRIRIEATVETPNDLPLTRAVVFSWRPRSDGLAPTQSEVRICPIDINPANVKKGADLTTWTLTNAEVPVAEGRNQIRLVVENQDGESLESNTFQTKYTKPVEPLAEIMLIDPAVDKTVKTPDYTFRFAVRSKSPLRKVALIRDGEAILEAKISGLKQLDETKAVKLNKGINKFFVLAANEGGDQVSRPMVINYQYSPVVRIVLERLENGADVALRSSEPRDGLVPFQRVQAGRQTLIGSVNWDMENDDQMAKITHVRVFANGQQLIPVKLLPPKEGERQRMFRAELELVRGENNQIAVRLPPELALDANSHRMLSVSCAHPAPARAFAHLLILSLEEEEKDDARDRVIRALKGTLKEKSTFTMPGFSEGGQIYGPLVKRDLVPERIIKEVSEIRKELRRRANAGKTNDAVIVYYRGGENLSGPGNLLTLGGNLEDAGSSSIGLDYIQTRLDENQGSRIWLLDTIQEQKDDGIARNPSVCNDMVANCDEPNTAMWRYAWQGKVKDQPNEARLLATLPGTLSQAGKLMDISKGLGATFTKPLGDKLPWISTKYSNPLLYNFYMATGLGDWSLEP